ncbi:MAG: DUF6311 domain-containing protein [Devosia sp.]
MDLPSPSREASSRDLTGTMLAVLLGIAGFALFVSWSTLIPTNIAWLANGDRAMHQLGWMFFRHAPWGLPPGASPNLGLELSNSIGLVDGLPLFAFPFKLIEAWLPEPFQYWGYWLLLCYMLQALFGYKIARALGAGQGISLLAAAFALITPAFASRYPMHMALGGHWLILAALYLSVRPQSPRLWAWPLLTATTAAVHAYLLAMVLALWVAALVQRLLLGTIGWKRAAIEIAAVALVTLTVLWTAGFLMTGSLGSAGFGAYKLNLLGPLIRDGWSEIFPEIPHLAYDYEGLSFLGVGILGLITIGLLAGAFGRIGILFSCRWWPLIVMTILLTVFALSNKIGFADHELVTIPIPGWATGFLAMFRSSGRFVWPLLYLSTIAIVALIGVRFRSWLGATIVVAALVLQLADSGQALTRVERNTPRPSAVWSSELKSPFWERVAAAGYDRIREIPPRGMSGDWKALSYYAVTHGMATDSVYLGRTDETALKELKARNKQMLATGTFEPNTIYRLDPLSALQAARHLRPDDLFATIDGRIIFARGGANLVEGLDIGPHSAIDG